MAGPPIKHWDVTIIISFLILSNLPILNKISACIAMMVAGKISKIVALLNRESMFDIAPHAKIKYESKKAPKT